MQNTDKQYDQVVSTCRQIFEKKLGDYCTACLILRCPSVTDQLYIKAARIRNLETKKQAMVNEGITPEFIGIVNYAVIAIIQLRKGISECVDMSSSEALEMYDQITGEAKKLMYAKNHDYDEAWRMMRTSSYTDLILMKLNRTKQIEDNNGQTLISEGIEANYFDMLNYAVFGLIKLMLE